jgi:hypothetical protein
MGTVTKPVIVQLHPGGSAGNLIHRKCFCVRVWYYIDQSILRSRVLTNFFICLTSTSTVDFRVQSHSKKYAIQLLRIVVAHDYLRSAGDRL